MPPSSGPGFVDGHLQESCPFTPDEAGVYAALARLVPAQAYSKADFVLKLACVRGYHKEKPRAETTAGELARILEWRDKNRMDEFLQRTLPQEEEFHRYWPTQVHGEDCFGHFVVLEQIADIEADELAKRLPREVMLDHRAQLFEAINLEKALISRRRGGLVYKHISIIDLKGITMGHFSNSVRTVITKIIALGSNYYPESLWRLYLINAPTVFRAIWAILKPTIHPETLSKTFILGGKNDYLPIFQREGLAMAHIPKALGGASAGLTARQFVGNARAMAIAARKVYPTVPSKDLLRVAAANLPADVTDTVGAAKELERRFTEDGPAAEGTFRVPSDPDMDPAPGSGPPSNRKSSLEIPQRMAELRGNIMSSLSLNRQKDRDGGGEGRSKGNSPSPPRSPRAAPGGGGLKRTFSGGARHNKGGGDGGDGGSGSGGGAGGGGGGSNQISPRRIPPIPSPTPSFRDADGEDDLRGGPPLPLSSSAPGNGKGGGHYGDAPLSVDVSAAALAAAAARDTAAREARHSGRGPLARLCFCCCPLAGCGGLDDVDVPTAATPPGPRSQFQPALSRVSERSAEESAAALGRGTLPILDAAMAEEEDEDDGSLVFYDVRENFSVYSGYSGAADSRAQSDVEE